MRCAGKSSAALAVVTLALATPARAASKAHGPVGNPSAWFGDDAYPAEALRAGQQGRTIAEVQIDDTGLLVSCRVASSSGSASLDQATCAVALQDRHYQPATDGRGRPIASHARLSILWRIPAGREFGDPVDVTAAPPALRTMEMSLTVAGDGTLEACHAEFTGRKPGETGDPCERVKVGSKVSAGLRRDGRPVGARIVTRLSEQVLVDP